MGGGSSTSKSKVESKVVVTVKNVPVVVNGVPLSVSEASEELKKLSNCVSVMMADSTIEADLMRRLEEELASSWCVTATIPNAKLVIFGKEKTVLVFDEKMSDKELTATVHTLMKILDVRHPMAKATIFRAAKRMIEGFISNKKCADATKTSYGKLEFRDEIQKRNYLIQVACAARALKITGMEKGIFGRTSSKTVGFKLGVCYQVQADVLPYDTDAMTFQEAVMQDLASPLLKTYAGAVWEKLHPGKWDIEETAQWMAYIKFTKYVPYFTAQNIRGCEMFDLEYVTMHDVEELLVAAEMNVIIRKRFLGHVQQVRTAIKSRGADWRTVYRPL